jgi:hypothetical protein
MLANYVVVLLFVVDELWRHSQTCLFKYYVVLNWSRCEQARTGVRGGARRRVQACAGTRRSTQVRTGPHRHVQVRTGVRALALVHAEARRHAQACADA